MFELERHAIQQVFKLPCPTLRESLLLAAIYAAQAILCTALLTAGYTLEQAPGMGWAIISAILVLQPGITASLAASVARICANVVGAIVALLIARWWGTGTVQLLAAMLIIIFVCELLRLDMGLRAGCVSAIIIMTFHDSRVVMTGLDRSVSVIIGSVLAVVVQIAGSHLKHLLFARSGPHALPTGSQ
jgi:uncharacterized membrane protein YgaE (UPF0421/DUF939 family)